MDEYNIKKLYEDMEMDLIVSMQRNLSNHLKEENDVEFEYPQWQAIKLKELKRYQRENKDIIGNYTKGLDKRISDHLQEELKQGSISAIKQYNKLSGENKNPNKLMNNSFFKTNDRKVNALINSVNNDLNVAKQGALRMINDEYRQIIFKSAFFVANGVKTEKQATAMAIKEISERKATMLACDNVSKTFLAGGLNCVEYKNGRRVNIASYAAMAVRTANTRAHLMGEGNFRKSIGRTLVQVTTHGGSCPLCSKWQGKVLIDDVYSGGKSADGPYQLLSEAMAQGFLHPNCRHGLTTYYPELEDVSYDEDEGDTYLSEEAKRKLQYLNLNIQRFSRQENGSLTSETIKDYKQKKEVLLRKKKELIRLLKNKKDKDLPYEDITDKMLLKATPNSHEIIFDDYFMDEFGVKHPIKGKEKVALPSKESEEYKMAKYIKKIFGGKIHLVPRIETEKGYKGIIKVSTPDYRWDGVKWDLKTPTPKGEFKNTLERFLKVKGAKEQAKNYIIDYRYFPDKSDSEILDVVEKTLKNRNWVNKLVVMRKDKVIKIYSKI